jgi:hypothetical protein
LRLPSKRYKILIGIILISLLFFLITWFALFDPRGEGSIDHVEIEISTIRPLVGENVTFDAIIRGGPPKEILWDFGDGNTSMNRSINHTFNWSGYFWIELVVIDRYDYNLTVGQQIGVQNHDIHEVLTGSRITNPNRGGMPYDLIYFDIYDGISRPKVTGRWTGTAVCRELDIFIMTNPTSAGPRLVSEDLGMYYGDFDVTREVDVPEDAAVDCDYIMVLQVIGGTITDYTLELTVEY